MMYFVKFITDADLPLHIGAHPSYLEFIKVLYLNYQGFSRVTTRRDVLAYYNRCVEAL